jgi:hypothetical protein
VACAGLGGEFLSFLGGLLLGDSWGVIGWGLGWC